VEIRRATAEDAEAVARLLHDFNTEYGDETPGVAVLTERIAALIEQDKILVILGGDGPDGLAQLQFRHSVWSGALDAYLEELYVAPAKRGQGIGGALMDAAMEAARAKGATRMDLATSVDDKAAIALYERSGFTNREGLPDGPSMLFYERDL
jgi:ribosomal protein S18 acetylase RimI-like enzyme